MRIASEWLRDFVALPPSGTLAHVFEMAGLGVEHRTPEQGEDAVWSLEVTSNRGDCLSAIGLAREIGAMTSSRVRVHAPRVESEAGPSTAQSVQIEIENGDDCSRYAARVVDGVTVGPSPEWMQKRLVECGMRPVNNVVDVTNYVMLEWGQPLHAFDAQVLAGAGEHRIVVRRAREGESLTTLDGVERALSPQVLVIADASRPIAIAGIMGGQESEVTQSTRSILLESARFNPSVVRKGKRVLDLGSEASRRFERGVDPGATLPALERAAQLLAEVAGGQVRVGVAQRVARSEPRPTIELRPSRCNAILGTSISGEQMAILLERLGFEVARGEEKLTATPPSWRGDQTREIDLIEEVARLHGYEQIPATLPRNANPTAGRSLSQRIEEHAREVLLRCGLSEILTHSLQSATAVEKAGLGSSHAAVKLRNALSEDYSQLRTSLLPSLLEALERNPRTPVRFFELAKVYLPLDEARPDEAQPNEALKIGIALLDAPPEPHWQKGAHPTDFFALKAVVNALLDALGAPPATYAPEPARPFHPGRCATVAIDGQEVGVMGEVHPEVSERYGLQGRAYLAQLHLDTLVRHISIGRTMTPLARFPSSDRDLALVVPHEVAGAQIESALREAGGALLEEARIFDIYTGPPIPEGHKSIAVALRFRARDRTLTEDEVESEMERLRQASVGLGAQLRA
jgi:phenylalanyl-tRNA synthetase beta chain